jgi:hypothetical protein
MQGHSDMLQIQLVSFYFLPMPYRVMLAVGPSTPAYRLEREVLDSHKAKLGQYWTQSKD